MAFFSLWSLPAQLALGQAEGVWGSIASWIQVMGLPGLWVGLSQGPLGRYLFYSAAATLLLTVGAAIPAIGGLLCWWRSRPGRALLAMGLLMAVLGGLAGLGRAASQPPVLHQGPWPLVAEAVLEVGWSGFLLTLTLLASHGDGSESSRAPSPAVSRMSALGLGFALVGAFLLLTAAFALPFDLSSDRVVSQLPDVQLEVAYSLLSLAAPAAILVAGSCMWRGAHWAPSLSTLGWLGIAVQGLLLTVGGWMALASTGLLPAAVASGLSTASLALLALWIQRALTVQLWQPEVGGN
jgi:hypothetical protein